MIPSTRYRNALLRSAILALILTLVTNVPARTVNFSGYTWEVRPTESDSGPGPNNWDENNVFVDAKGYLHLKITESAGKWYCSEVYLPDSSSFGVYQFSVGGRIDLLDPNVVLGLFNYLGPDGVNEIDIEFAHWGDPLSPIDNFTVYPADGGIPPTSRSFPFNLGNANSSTHTFNWTPASILFQSFRGTNSNPSVRWLFHPRDPQSHIPQVPLPVHINLWLFQGQAPVNGQEVELVIRSFSFTPM